MLNRINVLTNVSGKAILRTPEMMTFGGIKPFISGKAALKIHGNQNKSMLQTSTNGNTSKRATACD